MDTPDTTQTYTLDDLRDAFAALVNAWKHLEYLPSDSDKSCKIEQIRLFAESHKRRIETLKNKTWLLAHDIIVLIEQLDWVEYDKEKRANHD
jgi:hypothetical protein